MAPAVGGSLSTGALPWRRRLSRAEATILLSASGFALLAFSGAPLGAMFIELVRADPEALHLLGAPRIWELLARSVGLAACVTAVATAIGAPLGVVFARARLPLVRTSFALHVLPALLPPLVPALGWTHVLGRTGFVGSSATSALLYSDLGFVAVLGLALAPIVTTLASASIASLDPVLEDAGRVLASPSRVAFGILLPAARPAVATGALLVFALTLGELGVPTLLRVDVYAASVFARLGGIDYAPGEAATLVAPLIAVAIVLLAIDARLGGRRFLSVVGRVRRRERLDFGRLTPPLALFALFGAAISIVPLLSLCLRAFPTGFAALSDWIGISPVVSLGTAALAATVAVLLGSVIGYALARGGRVARMLDAIGVLAFLVPASVLGVGLVSVWNRPSLGSVYASVLIVAVGFVARYQIAASRACAAGILQTSESIEHAAAVAGASFLRRFWAIVLPMQRRTLAVGWLLVFVLSLRDLETVVLFYPPGGAPLTVRIFTLEANGPEPVVAALALVHVALTLSAALLAGRLLWPRARGLS